MGFAGFALAGAFLVVETLAVLLLPALNVPRRLSVWSGEGFAG